MAKQTSLSSEERELFRVVSRTVFCNPFSKERPELDRQMAGYVGGESNTEIAFLAAQRVTESVKNLEQRGLANLQMYTGEDYELVRTLIIFDVFNSYGEQFIDLIHKQIKAGAAAVKVPFARDALGLLVKRGLSDEHALRFFSMMYQLWRAFYFIDRKLVGTSPCMRNLRFQLWNNVFTRNIEWYGLFLWSRMEDFSTLLLGETGTGKGNAAAAIGQSAYIPFDPRKNCFVESFADNFIAINPSQFPESLIESELFGHRKGAFTGAIENHDGIFSRCSPYGSIFFDEVGDLSIPIQIKLLNVLQERTFCKVGSHERLRFHGRVMAATNKPLDELRRLGDFREDLYYRFCSNTIYLPPLRQRFRETPEEMKVLLYNIVSRIVGDEQPHVVEAVGEIIKRDLGPEYSWPGNVREFEQAVRSALLSHAYSPDSKIEIVELQDRLISGIDKGNLTLEELNGWYCALLYNRHGSYEEAARRAGIDWRTVRKHVKATVDKASKDGDEDILTALKRIITNI